MSLSCLPRFPLVSMKHEGLDFLSFTARKEAPKANEDWFRIVHAKKGSNGPTKVYIYDEIGYWGTNAKDFAAQLDAIETKEIHLHVNSPGGSVFDGIAIKSSLENHDATVTAYVDGLAASAASFIIQGADKRIIARNAQLMIHDASAYAGGNAEAFRKAAQLLDQISDNIADMYAQGAGATKTAAEFRAIMKETKWYTGLEALEEGLVDEVTDSSDEDAEDDAKNKWDLSAIENMVHQGDTPPPKLATLNSITINNIEENSMSQSTSEPSTPAAPVQPAAQAPAPAAPSPAAGAGFTMTVEGAQVTDQAAVQAHITTLENFRKETIEGGRRDFVAGLASSNKIVATQIDSMTDFALGLSNEQFTKWKASFDAAPAMTLTAPHGTTSETAPKIAPDATAKNEALRIKDLEEIVASHRAAGMSEESLKTKSSFIELQKLQNKTSAS